MIDVYSDLEMYCSRGRKFINKVQFLLQEYEDINIFYCNNIYIKKAIQTNNTEILQMLIDYYAEHTLSKYKIGSDAYLHAKNEFAEALNHGLEYAPPKTAEELASVRVFVREHAGYCYDDSEEEDELDDSELEYHSGSDEYLQAEDSKKQHNSDINFEQGLCTHLDRALSLHDKLVGE